MEPLQDAMTQTVDRVPAKTALVPTVSYAALAKAVHVLQDLVLYYFPLYGLSEADFLRFMPVLTFAEATAYQMDEEHEVHIGEPHFVSPYLPVLRQVLTQLNLYDEALETELQGGLTYWRLEQQLCSGQPFTEADIVRANRCRCCDYRFLHRLLCKLTARPYDEEVLDLCWLVEQMGEVEEDLRQYHADIQGNVYNTYRLFVRLYGAAAPHHLRGYLGRLEDEVEQRLARLAETRPDLASTWQALQRAYYVAHPVPAMPPPVLEHTTTSLSTAGAGVEENTDATT